MDALADAVDRQIADNSDSIEQRALRVAIASLREQLDDHPELPIDKTGIRQQFTEPTNRYRQHHTREAEIIRTALGIDVW